MTGPTLEQIRRMHEVFDPETWPLRDNVGWLQHRLRLQHNHMQILLNALEAQQRALEQSRGRSSALIDD